MALLNANPDWFPALRAVFAYGARTGAPTALDWPEETLLPISPGVLLLMIGGEKDGCIAHSGTATVQIPRQLPYRADIP
ncbi:MULTISPECIES: hypothetical protein [Microbulbifer]|uniref:hypothetical protein n=1 Tax=Microbulbifer TaxID=48073 RepID=UPI000A8CEAA7|nr:MULTISPECIES: hypothetical protein [Microbulbifer]